MKVRLLSGEWKQYNSGVPVSKPRSRQKAMAAANRMQGILDAGGDPFRGIKGERYALEETGARYLQVRGVEWSEGTAWWQRQTVKLFSELAGVKSVTRIDSAAIQLFISRLKVRGVVSAKGKRLRNISDHTINIHLRNIKCWLRWAVREYRIGEQEWVMPHIPQIRTAKQSYADYFQLEDIRRIVAAAKETCYYIGRNGRHRQDRKAYPILPFVLLGFATGMRMGEMLRLDWTMIDRAQGLIFLSGRNTKTLKSRIVPVPGWVLDVIVETMGDTGRLFPDWRAGGAREAYYRTLEVAGVRKLKPHNMRDTFAQHHLYEGARPDAVAAILGHGVEVLLQNYVFIGINEIRRGFKGQESGSYEAALRSCIGVEMVPAGNK